jgi:hypothetical protein
MFAWPVRITGILDFMMGFETGQISSEYGA